MKPVINPPIFSPLQDPEEMPLLLLGGGGAIPSGALLDEDGNALLDEDGNVILEDV